MARVARQVLVAQAAEAAVPEYLARRAIPELPDCSIYSVKNRSIITHENHDAIRGEVVENLSLWRDILLGPAGTAAVLLAFVFYYIKFYKPKEDERTERRELALIEAQRERERIAAELAERVRLDHRSDIERIISSCKEQMVEVVSGYERQMSMIQTATTELKDAVKENTRVAQCMTEVYARGKAIEIDQSVSGA